jgi:hypothetical protein
MAKKRSRKEKKNKNSKKDLKALKKLRSGGGGFLVRVYGDTATLRGTVVSSDKGLIHIKHKTGLGEVLTIVPEETVEVSKPGVVIVKGGHVPTLEFFAGRITRKDGIVWAETLEGERVQILSSRVEITSTTVSSEEEAEEEAVEGDENDETDSDSEAEESSDDEDEKPKKKKASKDDDDDDAEEEDEKPKKKKKNDDEDGEEDGDGSDTTDWDL